MSTEKSEKIVEKILKKNELKKLEYYKIMKKIRHSNKKYINRNYLLKLMNFHEGDDIFKIFNKIKSKNLTVEDLRKTVRVSIRHYFNQSSVLALLTSNKLSK